MWKCQISPVLAHILQVPLLLIVFYPETSLLLTFNLNLFLTHDKTVLSSLSARILKGTFRRSISWEVFWYIHGHRSFPGIPPRFLSLNLYPPRVAHLGGMVIGTSSRKSVLAWSCTWLEHDAHPLFCCWGTHYCFRLKKNQQGLEGCLEMM